MTKAGYKQFLIQMKPPIEARALKVVAELYARGGLDVKPAVYHRHIFTKGIEALERELGLAT